MKHFGAHRDALKLECPIDNEHEDHWVTAISLVHYSGWSSILVILSRLLLSFR